MPNRDIPLSAALVLLACVIGFLWWGPHLSELDHLLTLVEECIYQNRWLLIIQATIFFLNLAWMTSGLRRWFGYRKQGSRLRSLAQGARPVRRLSIQGYLMTTLLAALLFAILRFTGWPKPFSLSLPSADPFFSWLVSAIRVNTSFFSWIVFIMLARLSIWRHLPTEIEKISSRPAVSDGLVLGVINEDTHDRDQPPQWISMNQTALKGNILVTGSIGAGKSQGTILPYFDQILDNFSLRPSVLALDPKGTFIPDAMAIAAHHKMGEHIIELKLGGNVTFNPIYQPDLLQSSRFLAIAQMIRAAAVNYMGRPFDDPFWDISASNLIKNALVYCAAQSGYFTLNDLYEVLGQIHESHVYSDLEKTLKSPSLTEEERFNVRVTLQYLKNEFSKLEDRIRTSILTTSTSFLNQFQEYQASRLFCPKEDDLTLPSLDRVIDEGKLLFFNVTHPYLARPMATFIKLHYQQSILNRLLDPARMSGRHAVIMIDEYQDVVSTASGGLLGDNGFLAKARQANAISIVASQSISSLRNAVGKGDSVKELVQNFRTRIAGHSSDLDTVSLFRELSGQVERERVSRGLSEHSQDATRNYIHGGFESRRANVSESINVTTAKEDLITGKDLMNLSTFESYAHVYDGAQTHFVHLFLKPYYLKNKATSHRKLVESLNRPKPVWKSILQRFRFAMVGLTLLLTSSTFAFPNVCDVIATSDSDSCMDLSVSACMCGFPPRPCAQISYYLPETFVEVSPEPKSSHFSDLPGSAVQLASASSSAFGTESDYSVHSNHAHTIAVPFLSVVQNALSCRGGISDKFCFDGMSEHLGSAWQTGAPDLTQPVLQSSAASPKACLLAGAASSAAPQSTEANRPAAPTCSVPLSWIPTYPISQHAPCNGWGVFFPRSGSVHGSSTTIAALMVASRIKSLSTDVFQGTSRSKDEKWQMIRPQASKCFREGENIGRLELEKNVREEKRITSMRWKNYLFATWKRHSCCRDLGEVPVVYAAVEIIKEACKGMTSL